MLKRIAGGIAILIVLGAVLFFTFAPGIVEKAQNGYVAHAPYAISPEAQRLHDRLVIGDWHADSLMWKRDLLERGDRGHVDFPRLQEGNVAIQVFTTVTKSPAGQNYAENSAETRDNITALAIGQLWPVKSWFDLTERGLYMADRLTRYAEEAPEVVRVIRTKSDLDALLAARAEGARTIGALLGSEGGHILEGDIANLDRIFDAGFRLMGLTHFFDNALGGSLHGEGGAGLTDFGRQVVAEMVERHMIIDLAHASPQMAHDVVAMTDVPVILSHTGIRSHCEAHRNFEDDLMREIAGTGGVIGVGYWEDVTCDATPAGIARTIVAAVDLVGVDHVSLGSDYDGSVEVHMDSSELAALTQALIDEGLSDDDIAAVMGGNMVRVLSELLPE
ncbi:dipeptidase [Celeribacter indicus]|uniref:Membrane dipeptidase n=1 Tax=Celeribacter indicus TaxID=1208324 RepID=A0A0B5DYB6_9RHOB|nr:membrane dipeptidase [Celeribacter indicus]AJE48004.1 membrane dipeptidase [Celeribacter indicus]SDW29200.1 Zn-dependent dipeptidase, dipeptidase homolog [Celeribacter indicus]